MKVKMCGITSAEDAAMCEELGADALGFVHVNGRYRNLPIDRIADMCSTLGPMTTKVLVCNPQSREEAADMFLKSGTDALQIHSLGPKDTLSLRDEGICLIRAVKPTRTEASMYAECADALLFEAGVPGTGSTYDYSQVPVSACKRSIIAGGLTVDNIHMAIAVKPYALDVSSGVERLPGKKDPELVAAFIERCRR